MPAIQLTANAPPRCAGGRDRTLLRIAAKVHVAYVSRASRPPSTLMQELESLKVTYLDTILRDAERLETALKKGWSTAAEYQRESIQGMLESMVRRINGIDLGKDQVLPPIPSLSEIYHELVAAQVDFGSVELQDDGDGDGPAVCVTTDRITLEGIGLGSFRIDLVLGYMVEDSPLEWFRVVALQPNPASNDDEVTHPHVSQNRLCTGEAQHPIIQALKDGRLSEFFCLARSVLTTYNEGSAYVALDVWDGSTCDDCGDSCATDDLWFCDQCEHNFCGECMRTCGECRVSYCRNCLESCSFTDKWVCRDCAMTCEECGKSGLPEKIDEGLCPECFAEREEEDSEQEGEGEESEDIEISPAVAAEAPSASAHIEPIAVPKPCRCKKHAQVLRAELLGEDMDFDEQDFGESDVVTLHQVLGASIDQAGQSVIDLARSL